MGAFTPTEQNIINCVTIIVGILGFICSLLTVWLIYSMKKWNGFLSLVWTLAVSQAFFNMATFFLFNANNNVACQIHGFLLLAFGIIGSQYTFYISFSIFYIVFWCKPLNILKIYWYLFGLIVIPAMILGGYSVGEGYFAEGIQGSCFLATSQGRSNRMVVAYDAFHGFSFAAAIIIDIITLYLVIVRPNLKNAPKPDTRGSTLR